MSYVGEYDRLETAFTDEANTSPAVFGDMFRYSEEYPNMGIPIGRKIEKETTIGVVTNAGELAVTVNCRVIMLEPELFEGDLSVEEDFAFWTYTPKPRMMIRQGMTWEEDAGPHNSRMVNTLMRSYMERLDEHAKAVAAWEEGLNPAEPWNDDDYPSPSWDFTYKFLSTFPIIRPRSKDVPDVGTEYEDERQHFTTLQAVAEQFAPVEHLLNSGGLGQNIFTTQTAAQLEAHNDWLLDA